MIPSISITTQAANKILIITEGNKNLRLRLSVDGGGCSGFKYTFTIDDQLTVDDQVFKNGVAEVVIDNTSLDLLNGSAIDYVEDLSKSAFVITNPNSASSCGCGNSFTI